jgi:ABC-type antimicrobial peptide transport system permease subunit
VKDTVSNIEETWSKIVPEYPFQFTYLDEDFENMYMTEQKMGELTQYFSVLAVLIACLGLFGLASFTSEQRTKEISIRKVLGASEIKLAVLLCREFLFFVLVSNVLAIPFGYYAMNMWLQDFSYRTGIGYMIFVYSAVIALFIALLTVSYQAIKASIANPVNALKYE